MVTLGGNIALPMIEVASSEIHIYFDYFNYLIDGCTKKSVENLQQLQLRGIKIIYQLCGRNASRSLQGWQPSIIYQLRIDYCGWRPIW